ncbi:hypothetical protein ACVH9Z_08430 [Rhodococcus opacus]|uniref:hypothetical protein n=1 Tax=Rhodococcus TaxID=1827 RepID=UPI0005C16491|nr:MULTISPECIES: hypothetical protein [Rhodococcus]NHU42803.1 hypothetical protein [Rhodococcus sp. A14]MBA8961148.1 hypothetical protein [Rhodococcus opacus]MBP2202986.1 hypothetical protein [Rhodococcus opacus]MDI9937659.1 hypothetical protein [Rhodococcus sp. IEGM 1351]MDJ0415440.1 hypothetical protein [Rhodococcus opacus]
MRRFTRRVGGTIVALTLTAAAFVVSPPPVYGFAEDICYTEDGAPPHNCAPLPPECLLDDPNSPICGAEAFLRYGFTLRRPLGGRSLVHSDSTYIIARTVGFSEQDAYWIAAYDEATDLGTFAPRDIFGRLVPDAGALTTKDISGLVRTHFATGGFLFHFLPTMRGPADPLPNGLQPDVDDPRHEVMLTHLRNWALAGPGSGAPLCTGGFTNPSEDGDYATGATCYGDANPVQINGTYSLETPAAIPFTNMTGQQVISDTVLSSQFDSWIGENSWNARTGIYIHALGDRISHHVCTDAGTITPPGPAGPDFRIDLNQPTCDQGPHAVRHEYETGVDFAGLDPEDRTTEAALSMVYDELVNFARVRGTLDERATTPTTKNALLTDGLVPALEIREPVERLNAVTDVGCRVGVPAFPGNPVCRD